MTGLKYSGAREQGMASNNGPPKYWLFNLPPGRENCRVVTGAKVGLIIVMKSNAIVKIDPEIMSGEPCFAGTRVPVRTLLGYLEGGDSLDEFVEDFPTVPRKQAIAFLEQSADAMIATIPQAA
jgi:uncharacterized protein (DUF433 family)